MTGKVDTEIEGYENQPDATIDQEDPTQNEYYTILDEINVRLYALSGYVADTGETLQFRVTIDGQEILTGVAAGAGVKQYWFKFADGESGVGTTAYLAGFYTYLEAKTLKIELRKVTVAGTGNLGARAVWAKKS